MEVGATALMARRQTDPRGSQRRERLLYMENSIQKIITDLKSKHKEKKNYFSEGGAALLCHTPHVAPLAYLHKIFPPANEDQIEIIESFIGRKPINDHIGFLKVCNGLSLFSTSLALYGIRSLVSRNPLDPLPFGLDIPNIYERPNNMDEDAIIIGSYRFDGSNAYITPDGHVYYCLERDATPLMEWESLPIFLSAEIERLSSLFDEDGHPLTPEVQTLPLQQ